MRGSWKPLFSFWLPLNFSLKRIPTPKKTPASPVLGAVSGLDGREPRHLKEVQHVLVRSGVAFGPGGLPLTLALVAVEGKESKERGQRKGVEESMESMEAKERSLVPLLKRKLRTPPFFPKETAWRESFLAS